MEAAQARRSLNMSKYHIVGNYMWRLISWKCGVSGHDGVERLKYYQRTSEISVTIMSKLEIWGVEKQNEQVKY